ncbi:L,D-transpeptidase family protein [Helicobacter sp. MIT 05-5294]|uniref:L,D-transpeptidase family protein n=1 Tax=Helicobacter sp. MIT 05-5294 TaxID=1548150 RepID=UPI000B0C5E9A|nr:L,D-transpeptidase family protein [Helicobacter sp. MIT 05-5294]
MILRIQIRAIFLNLGISYPNEADKEYAHNLGKSAGGDIKIHGLPNGFGFAKEAFRLYGDWTNGCIAVDNESMQEIYNLVPIGTRITILP